MSFFGATERSVVVTACSDDLLTDPHAVPAAVALAKDALMLPTDGQPDCDEVSAVVPVNGKKKSRKNKKKKPTPTATTLTKEEGIAEFDQFLTDRSRQYHERNVTLFRTLATIPLDSTPIEELPTEIWFFVGTIVCKPEEDEEEEDLYTVDVQDIDGCHVQCVLDMRECTTALNMFRIGATIFIPEAFKRNHWVWSRTMETAITAFPIYLEDIRKMNVFVTPPTMKCECCSVNTIVKGVVFCECVRVVYCSATCKEEDWFRHNRMCGGTSTVCVCPFASSDFVFAVTNEVMGYVQKLNYDEY